MSEKPLRFLSEIEVAEAIAHYLRAHRWSIEGDSPVPDRGRADILASRGKRRLLVEAKGEATLNDEPGAGGGTSGNQVRLQIARAVYTAMSAIERQEVEGALALPLTPLHREYVKSIQSSLEALGIGVFWVDHDLRVIPDQGARRIVKKSRS